jgi:hypothetical protein
LPIIQNQKEFLSILSIPDTATIITGTKEIGLWETND